MKKILLLSLLCVTPLVAMEHESDTNQIDPRVTQFVQILNTAKNPGLLGKLGFCLSAESGVVLADHLGVLRRAGLKVKEEARPVDSQVVKLRDSLQKIAESPELMQQLAESLQPHQVITMLNGLSESTIGRNIVLVKDEEELSPCLKYASLATALALGVAFPFVF